MWLSIQIETFFKDIKGCLEVIVCGFIRDPVLKPKWKHPVPKTIPFLSDIVVKGKGIQIICINSLLLCYLSLKCKGKCNITRFVHVEILVNDSVFQYNLVG